MTGAEEDRVRKRILEGRTLPECLEALERTLIVEVLAACGNHRASAAGVLGIARESIHNKIRKYGIPSIRVRAM